MKSHTPLPQVIDMVYVHVVLSPYKVYTFDYMAFFVQFILFFCAVF